MVARKIVIVVRGDTEEDSDEAFDEAVASLIDGNVRGANRNERSGYYFRTEEVPAHELPA